MKSNPQDDSETSSGTMQCADIRGGKLEYEDRGDGEPVLLIHGALIAGSFLPLMDEPSLANYRLIRYHRRGYAGSTNVEGPPNTYIKQAAADAATLLQHLRVEQAHTVPGGPDQAVQDTATFFELEFPAVGRWEFDEEKAKKIEQPILYIQGSESLPFIQEGRDLVHTWFPQAENNKIQGVNHSMQMINPQAVAEVIADFLKRHPM